MNKQELLKLDTELAAEEAKIIGELEKWGVAVKNPAIKGDTEPAVPVQDRDNTGEDEYAHSVADLDRNFAIQQELEKRLEDIRRTRAKIKSGTYGVCESCSQVIHPDRLKVVPVASLCVSCLTKK